MTVKLFGNRIDPACAYCKFGTTTSNGKMVLCEKAGVVNTYYSCRKFKYDPLKRVPSPQPNLPEYDSADFKL